MLAPGRLGARCGLLAALLCASCSSTPTLPLPPPLATVDLPDERGLALVRGEAEAKSYVSVLNERTASGKITQADDEGTWEVEIEAQSGDPLTIWQEVDGETSEQKHTFVPFPR
jgi:hypothetical protein